MLFGGLCSNDLANLGFTYSTGIIWSILMDKKQKEEKNLTWDLKLKYIALGLVILGILGLLFYWIKIGMPTDF